ncbi:ExbD/TolR family protein [Rheinheimera sp. 4Y26]|uniref:ExbD/TolR family protein n=1 Tax=Rheinheimera sp. 4Y26 TaxID=2977811 RepID=UPI0021B12D23|nr:biopolymer transporter ExbD [Rheinheimera sp. 4Y26]MCT6699799.1 biopolymer transporter ExbD [Rheinheimera sp. 4Y26]
MAFGGDFEQQDEVISEINMTPLVDVMLVLLIIFIITVPVLTHSVQVELPRASNSPQQDKPSTITLSVNAKGEVFWNELPVSSTELEVKLAEAARATPQPDIQLRGDRTVAYEHVVKTMAAVQNAGLLKLGFVTDPSA